MKFQILLLICVLVITFSSCEKSDINPITSAPELTTDKGGGGNNNTGFIQSVLSSTASRLVNSVTDSIFVAFTQPSVSGWTLSVRTNNANVQVPPTVAVPTGVYSVYVPVTSSNITNGVDVIITVTLFTQSKTTTIHMFPLHATFPAPSLQSPGNNSSFDFRRQVIFDWNDNNNAYYYELMISENADFSTIMYDFLLNNSIYPIDYFNGVGVRYWRVRFVDGSGTGGPWSQVRSFTVRPQ